MADIRPFRNMSDDELNQSLAMQQAISPRPRVPMLNGIPPAPQMAPPTPQGPTPFQAAPQNPVAPKPPTPWQRIEHGLGRAANIAGDIISPAITSMIPGSDLYKEREQGRTARLEEEGARTGQMKEATAASEAGRQLTPFTPLGGQESVMVPFKSIGQLEAAKQRGEATEGAAQTRGESAENVQTEKSEAQKEHDEFLKEIAANKVKATPFDQWASNPQLYEAYLKAQQEAKGQGRGGVMSPYAAVRLVDYAYRFDPRLLPFAQEAMQTLAKQLNMPLPAGVDISTPPAGQPRNEAGTPIGLSQPESPTSQTRARGQMSAELLPVFPKVESLIDDLDKKGELGPAAGRVNEFITGTYGAGDPEFKQLRDYLGTIASGFSRQHLNTEKGLEPFNQMLGGPMTRENLQAGLSVLRDFMQRYKHGGSGNQPNEPSRPAGVPEGAIWHPEDKTWRLPR